MTTELSTGNNILNCPDCGQRLTLSEIESTLTDEKYLCTNSSCPRKSVIVKTPLGKAAQVAPIVVAAGVVIGWLGQMFKNQDD